MCVKPTVDAAGNFTTQPIYQEFVVEGAEFEKYRVKWWEKVEQYYMLNT